MAQQLDMSLLSLPSLSVSTICPDNSSSSLSVGDTAQLQARLAALVQQLAGCQQHQHSLNRTGNASMPSSLQAAYAAATGADVSAQDCMEPYGSLARTSTHAGAVLRTLSTRNPRVLALAAAAAKTPAGSPEHAAVLSALKDEIMHAANKPSTAPAGHAAAEEAGDMYSPTAGHGSGPEDAGDNAGLQLPQQQPLTQDALWAALMAKAAARSGIDSDPSSPQKQHQHQHRQQLPTPKPLPGHGSADSAMETEAGTSCSLPWALLQAAQQAQQEEEEKEAAAAAAAAAEAAAAPAPPAAAATPSAMAVDGPEISTGSPRVAVKSSSNAPLARNNSTLVFKRRNLSNSTALQKHFSRPAQQQPAPAPLARTQSEVGAVPKPQYTFKKQTRKKPLLLRNNSSSNLAALQQAGKQQAQQQQQQQQQQQHSPQLLAPAAAAAAAEPECSADTGNTAATGPVNAAPTASNISLRAPAVTAPAAIGAGGVTDVLSFLASRQKQLHALQEQLQVHRRRMAPASSDGHSDGAGPSFSGLAAAASPAPFATPTGTASAGPGSPTYSSNTAAAIFELQRMLSSMAAAAGPNSPAAAAAAAAGALPLTFAMDDGDVHMAECGDYDAPMLAQARYRLMQQQQQQQQQPDPYGTGTASTMTTIKALAAALQQQQQQAAMHQQQQLQPMPPPVAPGFGGRGTGPSAELLRKLAAALQPAG